MNLNQIEKSALPHSIPITDGNNVLGYIAPGNPGDVFTVSSSGVPEFAIASLGAVTNALSLNQTDGLVSTVNSKIATQTIPSGTIVNAIGFDGAGMPVHQAFNQHNIRSESAATTIVASDYTVVFTNPNLTQPLGTSVAKQILNLKNNSSGNLTVTGTIDGVTNATINISTKSSLTFHGDGITWFII